MNTYPWSLRNIKLTNILGFLGVKEFTFYDGLQVIEAENHTGKSSLAIALIWGLTGRLPSIDRISSNTFKIKHKLAPGTDKASIEITLENIQGNRLTIQRSTTKSSSKNDLYVCLDGKEYEDGNGQKIIDAQLGLKPSSLEGCCVILQDQRLSLIAGDLKKSSGIIHDILGLTTLSKLVPIINKILQDLKKLISHHEGVDPLKRWKEQHENLRNELFHKEKEAVENGYASNLFNSSNFLTIAFSELCKELGVNSENITDAISAKKSVTVIREAINKIRSQNPFSPQIAELSKKLDKVSTEMKRVDRVKNVICGKIEKYQQLAIEYKLKQCDVAGHLDSIILELASKKEALARLREQAGLFTHSLALLNKQDDPACCPLCEQPINYKELIERIQGNISDSLRISIEKYEQEIVSLESSQKDINELNGCYRNIENEVKVSMEDLLDHLNDQYGEDCNSLRQILKRGILNQLEDGLVLSKFQIILEQLEKSCESIKAEIAQLKEKESQFNEDIKPKEEHLERISLYLIPIFEVQRKLLDHEVQKCKIENQGKSFQHLLSQVKKYENQLKEFKNYLQSQEKEKAGVAIETHGSFVSSFFAKVANNPDYDKISITACEDRGSIKYDFEAMSTKNSSYTDSAKHVLSGGDLSCACLGLMLSLTKGKGNKAGFLVLDDPGESFDNQRLGNFAKEIQSVCGHQTIIMTHQKELAEQLRKSGAKSVV